MYSRIAVSGDEGEQHREAIHQFIQQRLPQVACFLMTTQRSGQAVSRQVGAHVEGWTVGTITQPDSLKVLHVRRNPLVSYLWVELGGAEERRPARNVLLQGTCEVVSDPAEVMAFLERRAALRGMPAPQPTERILLRTTTTMVRAEGWTGGEEPVILRSFA